MYKGCVFVVFFLMSWWVGAQQYIPAESESPKLLAHIEVHTVDELNQLLKRSEQLFDSGELISGKDTPVAFVLHGREASSLFNMNYKDNKALVDLAARLSAFEVVEIKVCKTWMGGKGLDESQLPPFVGTVPLGPAEQRRLLKEESYVYF